MKICPKCKKLKPIEDFQKKNVIGELRQRCEKCTGFVIKWQKEHPARRNEINKEWMITHPEKLRLIRKKASKKYRSTPKGKISGSLSALIRRSLIGNKNKQHWEYLVDFTNMQLKKHLENQFKEGMTWENYGEWHIDHITPISAFSFEKTSDVDFKKCWSLSNLRPLWAKENLQKGAKYVK